MFFNFILNLFLNFKAQHPTSLVIWDTERLHTVFVLQRPGLSVIDIDMCGLTPGLFIFLNKIYYFFKFILLRMGCFVMQFQILEKVQMYL
jgi:hypothetical protein